MNKEGDIVEFEEYFYMIIAYYHIIIIFHSNKGFNYFQIEKPKKAKKKPNKIHGAGFFLTLKQTKKRSNHDGVITIVFPFYFLDTNIPNLNRIGFSNSNFIKRSKKKTINTIYL